MKFTSKWAPCFLAFELTNSETPVGCFQVLSYVKSVAIGVIFIKFWVPQQCYVTSGRRWSRSSYIAYPAYMSGRNFRWSRPTELQRQFCVYFPNYPLHSSTSLLLIHHLPFYLFQTHSTAATTEALLSADQHLQHSSVNRFCFLWVPNSAPPSVGFYFDIFCFPCSSVFCVVFTETLVHLAVNVCLFMPLFYSLVKV